MKFCFRKKKSSIKPQQKDSELVINKQKKEDLCVQNLVRGFACPHLGCSFGSCQDSLYANSKNGFFSVVDGVSEGMGQSYYVMLLSRYNSDAETVRLTALDAQDIHNLSFASKY